MLADVISKKKMWSINSAEAQKVHHAIGKMIAVDIQPYSVVEDDGFKEVIGVLEPRYVVPSRKFFSEKIIPVVSVALLFSQNTDWLTFDLSVVSLTLK